ncbi:MAG: hypothetical protein RMJ48_10785 [Roseiflexaceae bacterium]|nr:hypothetical protein [Roseiflexaceae bacterium]
MAVRSKPLGPSPQHPIRQQRSPAAAQRKPSAPHPIVEPPARAGIGAPAGILMLLFGLPLWALGAKYTLDGIVIGINTLATFLELPARVPAPTGWRNLLLIPVGLLFSYVESGVRLNFRSGPTHFFTLLVLLILTHGIDIYTTYLGISSLAAQPSSIGRLLNLFWWSPYIAAIVLTYLPELLIRGGWSLLTE